MHRAFLLVLLAGCPGSDSGDPFDPGNNCPKLDGAPFALGTDLGDSWYADTASYLVPGSSQLLTLGRWDGTRDDFAGTYDATVLDTSGIELSRVDRDHFLVRATDPGSACIELSDGTETTNLPMFAMHPLRLAMRSTERGASSSSVFAIGSTAVIELWTGGGQRIADPDMTLALPDRVYRTRAWDVVQVNQLGPLDIGLVTSDGIAETIPIEVIAKPDAVLVGSPKEMPAALPAGQTSFFCFYGTYQEKYVAGFTWTFTITNATWTTSNGLGEDNVSCVMVTPSLAGQRVEITASANGVSKSLGFDVF